MTVLAKAPGTVEIIFFQRRHLMPRTDEQNFSAASDLVYTEEIVPDS